VTVTPDLRTSFSCELEWRVFGVAELTRLTQAFSVNLLRVSRSRRAHQVFHRRSLRHQPENSAMAPGSVMAPGEEAEKVKPIGATGDPTKHQNRLRQASAPEFAV